MMPASQALIAELHAETPATRRVLARIPDDRLDWRPHPKSFSLGQLAQHVASIPGRISQLMKLDGLDIATRSPDYPACTSRDAVLKTLDESVETARAFLGALDAPAAAAPWKMSHGEQVLFEMPRIRVVRIMLFNHWYHHRGELVVYLRLLDLPVPAVYGRSADEGPGNPPAS